MEKNFTIPAALLPFTRRAFSFDIATLKDNLRPDDMRDVMELCGHTPEQALWFGLRSSGLCVTFFMPGRPEQAVGMGGLVLPGIAWALFHKDFLKTKEERKVFLKACPLVRDWFLSQSTGGFIHNVTLARNRKIRRWLNWLGAKEVSGMGTESFVHFYITTKEDNHHV